MTKTAHPKHFEDALQELEEIIAQMEAGQVSLEQSLASYQRGAMLLQYCQKALADAEQQVRVLTETQALLPYTSRDD